MGKAISFWWDAEKRIRVARAGEPDSLFYEAYRQALAGVAEIIRASIMQTRSYDSFFPGHDGKSEPRTTCDSQYLYDYPNNIIVFSGERGAGKSSAMLTFVSGLTDPDGLLFKDDFLSGMVTCELPNVKAQMVKQMLQSCTFVDLPPIDPTTLEDDGQILTVILARMFQLASDTWESGSGKFGREFSAKQLDEKNQLIQKFSDCYEHIRAIKKSSMSKGEPEYDGLETLAELGDSSRLKVELYELVELLLKFCRPEAGDSSYLVLQIDDTDMNIKNAYDILEDMRRYLVIPRLIIVMAADLKHLMQVVESSLLKNYDNSLDSRHEYVEKISHQYITKLFPQTRQIDLPALATYLREHIESMTISYRIPGDTILPDQKGNIFTSPQDQIFRLIYQKTGMVFLKQEHRLHPIIPCNMRLLAHFLSMLVQMEDVDNPDAEEPGFFLEKPDPVNTYKAHTGKLRTRLQNIQRFRSYFLTTWVNNSLESKSVQLFKDLEQIDIADRIRYICSRLTDLHHANTKDSSTLLKKYCGNGQYADMVRICQDIARTSWDEELKRLAFALQIYCSLFAQILAVEDLIDYYDARVAEQISSAAEQAVGDAGEEEGASQYASGRTGPGCSFSRLHLLFGSWLFPYSPVCEEPYVTMNVPSSEPRTEYPLNIAWKLEEMPPIPDDPKILQQYATLLYSMLADYRPSDNGEAIWFDLTRPIINCLYLGDRDGQTPLFQTISNAVPFDVALTGEDVWHRMRNSSLITVLNCDVHAKISAALQRKILTSQNHNSMESSIDYNNWITRVRDMYAAMKDALITDASMKGATGKGAPQNQPPINFLKNIDFFSWMDSVATKGVEALDGWAKIVGGLNQSITYTPPPADKDKSQTNDSPKELQVVSDKESDSSTQLALAGYSSENDKPNIPE